MLDQFSRFTILKLSFRESMLEHQSGGNAVMKWKKDYSNTHSHPQQQPHQHQQQQQSQASINNAGFGESGLMDRTAGRNGAVGIPQTEILQVSFP